MSKNYSLPTAPSKVEKWLRKIEAVPQKKLGQNFLLDMNVQREIVAQAQLTSTDVVLEIGAGLGHLTQFLDQAHIVFALEIDTRLFANLQQRFAHSQCIRLLHLDVLANKHAFNPDLLAILHSQVKAHPFKVVANLPYSIATPIIRNLVTIKPVPQTIVVTVQTEVAERMVAAPGTKQYGFLSVYMQLYAKVEKLRDIPAHCFYPRPKINSSIVKIIPQPAPAEVEDEEATLQLVKAVLQTRRKTIYNALRRKYTDKIAAAGLRKALQEAEIATDVRGETLSVGKFIELTKSISRVCDE